MSDEIWFDVDGERAPLRRCESCHKRPAVNWFESDMNETLTLPTKCDECSYACNDSDCCGVFEHVHAEEIRAEAKRRGWEE